MWERFSFYGMRAMLTLYLIQHFLFGPVEAQGIYAAYGALVYLLPVVGGLIADKYLGSRKAVIIGAVLLVAGHFTMAFEGSGGREFITVGGTEYAIQVEGRNTDRQLYAVTDAGRVPISIAPEGVSVVDVAGQPAGSGAQLATAAAFPATIAADGYTTRIDRDPSGEMTLFLALSLIIVGVGFLKANISTVVGHLYEENDPRRDGGFTLFYVGINLGSVLATGLCSYLGFTYGWAYGFGLAGFGMLLGLATFLLGQSWLEGRGGPPNPEKLAGTKVLGIPLEATFWILGLIAVFPVWLLMQRHEIISTALPWLAGIIFALVVGYTVIKLQGAERARMLVAQVLIFFSVLFWALFEQAGSSLNLFTDRHVDRGGVPASVFQSINAIYIILLAPIFATLWTVMGRKGIEPSTPLKFGLGVIQVGLGFLVLVWGARSVGLDVPVPVLFIFLIYLLHTTGELCLSPVGLSAMNRLAPAHLASLIMGVWFFASATGNFAAGLIAAATGAEGVGEASGKAVVIDVYSTVGWTAVGVGILVMVISPLIKKLMHLDTLQDDNVGDDLEGQAEAGEPQAAGMHPTTKPL